MGEDGKTRNGGGAVTWLFEFIILYSVLCAPLDTKFEKGVSTSAAEE